MRTKWRTTGFGFYQLDFSASGLMRAILSQNRRESNAIIVEGDSRLTKKPVAVLASEEGSMNQKADDGADQ